MVLRITVIDADILREAVQAVPVAGSPMVILIWTPDYFAVQSVLTEKLRPGENPTTLLKIAPEGFGSYDSTDRYFNAVIETANLEGVFFTANDSEPIEFSQSFEDNGLNDLGYLHARFNRPVGYNSGKGQVLDYISLKIYGILPEQMLQSADISHDPSPNPLPPVATFRASKFAQLIATLETLGMSVVVTVLKGEVFFSAGGRIFEPLVMKPENGLISTRDDVRNKPIRFEFHMQNLDIHPGARLSDEVLLYKRTEEVIMLWFKLERTRTLLKGDIIYYFY